MTTTLAALAEMLSAELRGDPSYVVTGAASLDRATADQVSFLDSSRFRKALSNTQAGAVLLKKDDASHWPGNALLVDDPKNAFIDVVNHFHPEPAVESGIHETAVVSPEAELAEGVSVGPRAVIGPKVKIGRGSSIGAGSVITSDCVLGEDCVLHPNVTLYPNVRLGNRVVIHAGSVLGADGFGYHQTAGRWRKVPQVGGVSIGDDVEIGALTSIDCGALDDTLIGAGSKIDDHVMIGHNVVVGTHTVVAGCSGIAGSSKIGHYCVVGGMTAIGDHVTITDQVMFTGCSMVTSDVKDSGVYSSGTGLMDRRAWHRMVVRMKQLDDMGKRITALEKEERDS